MNDNIISLQDYLKKRNVDKQLAERLVSESSQLYKKDLETMEKILNLVEELRSREERKEVVELIRKNFLVEKS